MKNISRRGFLKTAAAAECRVSALHHRRHQGVRPGARGQRHHPRRRRRHQRPGQRPHRPVPRPEGRAGHLPDRPRHAACSNRAARRSGTRAATTPKCVQDIRKALDDKNLDAISIATPNHWHSLMTIWACQAGKDVYVEKPMQPQRPRRPHAASRRPASTTASCSTAPSSRSSGSRANEIAAVAVGQVRQAARLEGLLLQAALEHRPQGRSPRRRRTWTSTSGSGRRPSSRTTATWSTTTGTGSGTSATATSATRASTRWTSPAGPSRAPRCRRKVWSLGGRFADERPGPDAQHADGRHGIRRRAAGLRGPRPGRQAEASFPFKFKVAQRVLHDRGHDRRRASSIPRAAASPSRWPSSTSR